MSNNSRKSEPDSQEVTSEILETLEGNNSTKESLEIIVEGLETRKQIRKKLSQFSQEDLYKTKLTLELALIEINEALRQTNLISKYIWLGMPLIALVMVYLKNMSVEKTFFFIVMLGLLAILTFFFGTVYQQRKILNETKIKYEFFVSCL